MIKINDKLAIVAVRHNTKEARKEISSILQRINEVPFKIKLGLELNKQDAYYI